MNFTDTNRLDFIHGHALYVVDHRLLGEPDGNGECALFEPADDLRANIDRSISALGFAPNDTDRINYLIATRLLSLSHFGMSRTGDVPLSRQNIDHAMVVISVQIAEGIRFALMNEAEKTGQKIGCVSILVDITKDISEFTISFYDYPEFGFGGALVDDKEYEDFAIIALDRLKSYLADPDAVR